MNDRTWLRSFRPTTSRSTNNWYGTALRSAGLGYSLNRFSLFWSSVFLFPVSEKLRRTVLPPFLPLVRHHVKFPTQVGSYGFPSLSAPAQDIKYRSPFWSRISIASHQVSCDEELSGRPWLATVDSGGLLLVAGEEGLGILHIYLP